MVKTRSFYVPGAGSGGDSLHVEERRATVRSKEATYRVFAEDKMPSYDSYGSFLKALAEGRALFPEDEEPIVTASSYDEYGDTRTAIALEGFREPTDKEQAAITKYLIEEGRLKAKRKEDEERRQEAEDNLALQRLRKRKPELFK